MNNTFSITSGNSTHCNMCRFCNNLKMTEYNLFCYAEDREKDGFQQPRYRIFNKEVSEEEYKKASISINGNPHLGRNTHYQTGFREWFMSLKDKTTIESFEKLPGFTWEVFFKYWGVNKIIMKEKLDMLKDEEEKRALKEKNTKKK